MTKLHKTGIIGIRQLFCLLEKTGLIRKEKPKWKYSLKSWNSTLLQPLSAKAQGSTPRTKTWIHGLRASQLTSMGCQHKRLCFLKAVSSTLMTSSKELMARSGTLMAKKCYLQRASTRRAGLTGPAGRGRSTSLQRSVRWVEDPVKASCLS